MFIKKIKKKHLNTNKSYFVFQLFEEVETEGKKKNVMVLTLGTKLNIPESEHQMLADCIEAKARNKSNLEGFSDSIQALADDFAKQLITREKARRKNQAPAFKKNSSKPFKSDSLKKSQLRFNGRSLVKKGFRQQEVQEESKETNPRIGNRFSKNRFDSKEASEERSFKKPSRFNREEKFEDFEVRKESKPRFGNRFSKNPFESKEASEERSFKKPSRFNREEKFEDFEERKESKPRFGKRPSTNRSSSKETSEKRSFKKPFRSNQGAKSGGFKDSNPKSGKRPKFHKAPLRKRVK